MKKAAWALIILLIGYFYGSVGYALTHAKLPSAENPIKFYATETHHDLQITFVQTIDDAEDSIRLIIYSLRDKKVINALKRAAERGIDVEIVCDHNASSGLAKKMGSKVKVTYRKSKGLMHQKIMITDSTLILCGSANLTTASLKSHGNLVVGIYSKPLAAYLLAKFSHMKTEGLIEPSLNKDWTIGGQHLDFWFFPDNTDGVEKIKELLRSAEKSVKIAMFTWTRYDLADAVISAKQKGIKIEVVLDRNASNGVSKRIAEKLTKGGVDVRVNRGQELLHHKFLLIDDKTLVNGSANWTKAAFTYNDDFFLVLSPLSDLQKKTLNEMWEEVLLHSKPYSTSL